MPDDDVDAFLNMIIAREDDDLWEGMGATYRFQAERTWVLWKQPEVRHRERVYVEPAGPKMRPHP